MTQFSDSTARGHVKQLYFHVFYLTAVHLRFASSEDSVKITYFINMNKIFGKVNCSLVSGSEQNNRAKFWVLL